MGFQDNSGDIIFDVVLTDEGRRALSDPQIDFKVVKFKVSDDEINYELFNLNTGSAYQDLQILQTPVFEAFTNNTSNMSSLLVTYTANDYLYLPVLELNEIANGQGTSSDSARHSLGTFMVAVDQETEGTGNQQTIPATSLAIDSTGARRPGFLFGITVNDGGHIRVDAGIDNSSRPPNAGTLDSSLFEDGYLLELDSRLGRLMNVNGMPLPELYTDDDSITVYRVTHKTNEQASDPVKRNQETAVSPSTQVIRGLRSTYLRFKIETTPELRQSNFYFDKFGSLASMENYSGATPSNNARIIDTLIKVTGIKTGYTLDIPVRFVKLKT